MNDKTLHIFLQSEPYPEPFKSNEERPSYFSSVLYTRVATILGSIIQIHAPRYAGVNIFKMLLSSFETFAHMRQCKNDIFVVWQGHGMYGALLNKRFDARSPFILNTYKVPKNFHRKIKTRINDKLLCKAIKQAFCVVTISYRQADEIRYYNKGAVCVPFASDINWWTPKIADYSLLQKYAINFRDYVLIMGDVNRDEETTARAIKGLNYPILRVTRDPKTVRKAEHVWLTLGIKNGRILEKVPFKVLREIYRGARVVIIPARSEMHPAGMTSMTEAMGCARPVIIPSGLTTEGYVQNEIDAFVLDGWRESDIRDRVVCVYETNRGELIGLAARKTVEEKLNFDASAGVLADFVRTVLL